MLAGQVYERTGIKWAVTTADVDININSKPTVVLVATSPLPVDWSSARKEGFTLDVDAASATVTVYVAS
jgi:hypothetical protein